jgi:hypothetical protein
MSRYAFLVMGIAALMLLSPVQTHAWQLTGPALKRTALPLFARPVGPAKVDFDGDGIIETVTFSNGHAIIRNGDEIRWESPTPWQVQQVQIADLDNDNLPEIILLVWRPFKPWPVDTWVPRGGRIEKFHNAAGMSCHIILIGWNGDSFRERWAGSAMADPVKAFAVADLAGNGKQLLITLESKYDDPPSAPGEKLKVWEWNGFGFTVVSQVSGAFNQLAIARESNGRLLIIAP